jgi:hypothetical protein
VYLRIVNLIVQSFVRAGRLFNKHYSELHFCNVYNIGVFFDDGERFYAKVHLLLRRRWPDGR